MGLLVDGVWQDEQHIARTSDGRFVRPTTRFRNWVTEDGSPGATGEGGFAAARGRYHLYVALPCPWAHRTVIMRMLKGLEDVVSMSVLEPLYGPHGWRFGTSPGTVPDSVNGASELAEIYLRADPRYTGRVSVPALWDKERRTIVNNESAEIIRMLNGAFGRFTNAASCRWGRSSIFWRRTTATGSRIRVCLARNHRRFADAACRPSRAVHPRR